MKKIIKKAICFICAILFFQSGSIPTYADESAAFYVQTAAALSDGMIRVSVYLKDADNLAGIDAELFFDSTKVSFEGSSLGDSYSGSYSDINYDNENSKVHYVMLYPDGNNNNGILFTVDFKVTGEKSYQPELKINSLIDSSDEMNEIPYSIKYQQADGSWSDNIDRSGKIAEKKVIDNTLKKYGSEADIKSNGNPSNDSVSIDSNNKSNGVITDDAADGNEVFKASGDNYRDSTEQISDKNSTEGTELVDNSEINENKDKQRELTIDRKYLIVGFVSTFLIIFVVFYIVFKRRNNRKN